MNAKRCCREAGGWVLPGVGLVLIPKCPMCVAGYIAAFTGVGVSMPVAAGLRWTMLILCISALAFVATRTVVRIARNPKGGVHPTVRMLLKSVG